jgi:hypothetical protein
MGAIPMKKITLVAVGVVLGALLLGGVLYIYTIFQGLAHLNG